MCVTPVITCCGTVCCFKDPFCSITLKGIAVFISVLHIGYLWILQAELVLWGRFTDSSWFYSGFICISNVELCNVVCMFYNNKKKAQKPKENNMLPMRPIARRDQRHKQTVKLTDWLIDWKKSLPDRLRLTATLSQCLRMRGRGGMSKQGKQREKERERNETLENIKLKMTVLIYLW